MSNFVNVARLSGLKVVVMGVLALGVIISPLSAASANPFKKVSGKWRSAGATAIIKGNKERIKCRASYQVPGRNMSLNLKCSGPGYYLNVYVDARVIGSKVKGGWSETQFGKSGWLSGRASGKSSNLSFGGSAVKGSMSIAFRGRKRHSIYIRANGTRISIPFRR